MEDTTAHYMESTFASIRAVHILQECRDLLAKGWCQKHSFEDALGNPCRRTEASRYCMAGALQICCDWNEEMAYNLAVFFLTRATGNMDYIKWNDADGRTQADVLAAMDKAIKDAEASVHTAAN